MRLSIDGYSLINMLGEEMAFRMIKEAGFDAIDYPFFWLDDEIKEMVFGDKSTVYAERLKKKLSKVGLECNQAHAPFDFDSSKDEMDCSNSHFNGLIKSIEIAAYIGAENIVIHAVEPFDNKNLLESNIEFYKRLEPYAKTNNIKIGIENLFTDPYDEEAAMYTKNKFGRPGTMHEILESLNSPWFVCCIDTGHAVITGIEPDEMIRGIGGDKLKLLHINDNDYHRDKHTLPYIGKINWDNVARSLADINYDGDITFEIFKFVKGFEDDMIEEVLRFAAYIGRYMINKIDKYRKDA